MKAVKVKVSQLNQTKKLHQTKELSLFYNAFIKLAYLGMGCLVGIAIPLVECYGV